MSSGTTGINSYLTKNDIDVADLISIGSHNTVRGTAESTVLLDEWKKFVPTYFESQDITFNCRFDYTGYNNLFTALTAGTLDKYNMYFPVVANSGYTDSEGNTASALSVMNDGVLQSGGIYYPTGSWNNWIDYDFGKAVDISRVRIWHQTNVGRCVATSADKSTWTYYAATGSGVLTDHTFAEYSTEAEAITHYWQEASVDNLTYGKFPTTVSARYVRYFWSNYNTVYEFLAGAPTNEFNAYVTNLEVDETNGSEILSYNVTLRTSGDFEIL